MPDISMCFGGECPLKNSCYRFLAKPENYEDQTYFSNPPFDPKKDPICQFYWESELRPNAPS